MSWDQLLMVPHTQLLVIHLSFCLYTVTVNSKVYFSISVLFKPLHTYVHEPAVEMLSRSCIGRHHCDCAECQLSELCVILLLRGAMSEMQKEGFSKKLVLKSTGQGGATL